MTNSTYKIPDMMDSDLKIPPNDSFSRLTYEIRNAAPELYSEYFYAGTTAINWADRMDALAAKDAEIEAQGSGEVVYQVKDETLDAWYDVAKARWDNYDSHLRRAIYTTPPSAPVEVVEALSELVDLMQGVIDGEYKPDSFTLQPARAALAQQPAADRVCPNTLQACRCDKYTPCAPAAAQKGYKNGLNAALGIIANLGIADSEAQTNGREDAYRAVEALAAQHGGLRQ